MKNKKIFRNIIYIAILMSLSVVLSLFDRYISLAILNLFPYITFIFPYFKIGIANIIILIIIYNYDFKFSLVAVILKSCILAIFAISGLTTFVIGFTGTILSFFVMYLLKKVNRKSTFMIFVSMVGGFTHTLGQVISSLIFYQNLNITSIILYSPFILIIGLISGLMIGLITFKLNDLIQKHNLLKTEGDKTNE
jgi:heptaprenyl diphosphate synthase